MKLPEPFPATSSPGHGTTNWVAHSSQRPEQSEDFLSGLREPARLLAAGTNTSTGCCKVQMQRQSLMRITATAELQKFCSGD